MKRIFGVIGVVVVLGPVLSLCAEEANGKAIDEVRNALLHSVMADEFKSLESDADVAKAVATVASRLHVTKQLLERRSKMLEDYVNGLEAEQDKNSELKKEVVELRAQIAEYSTALKDLQGENGKLIDRLLRIDEQPNKGLQAAMEQIEALSREVDRLKAEKRKADR